MFAWYVVMHPADPCIAEAQARARAIAPWCVTDTCLRDARSEILGACVPDPLAPQ
jgi:hypothetical protein